MPGVAGQALGHPGAAEALGEDRGDPVGSGSAPAAGRGRPAWARRRGRGRRPARCARPYLREVAEGVVGDHDRVRAGSARARRAYAASSAVRSPPQARRRWRRTARACAGSIAAELGARPGRRASAIRSGSCQKCGSGLRRRVLLEAATSAASSDLAGRRSGRRASSTAAWKPRSWTTRSARAISAVSRIVSSRSCGSCAGLGQVVTWAWCAGHPLGDELQRVERGRDLGARGVGPGERGAARQRPGQQQRARGEQQRGGHDGRTLHENDSQHDENHCQLVGWASCWS